MKLTRRHARAVVAGAATTALYLAGAKASDSRTVRGAGLLALMMAGVVSAQDTASKAKSAHKRIDALVPAVHDAKTAAANALPKTGGTISGSLVVNSGISCGGNLDMENNSVTRCYGVNPADGNANVHSSGGLTPGGNIDMGGSNVNNCNAISNGSSQVSHPSGLNSSEIGPGGTRANLGSFTVTTIAQAQTAINSLQARSDFHNGQLNASNVDY